MGGMWVLLALGGAGLTVGMDVVRLYRVGDGRGLNYRWPSDVEPADFLAVALIRLSVVLIAACLGIAIDVVCSTSTAVALGVAIAKFSEVFFGYVEMNGGDG